MAATISPYYHHAPVAGRMNTFANLEYPTEDPPSAINIDGLSYVKIERELDYRKLFAKTLHEVMVETFARHGIDRLYEDEFDSIVTELTERFYHQTVGEFRRKNGLSVFPDKTKWM